MLILTIRYEETIKYLKELPLSVPIYAFEFLDSVKEILQRGEFITRVSFLTLINNLNPSSEYWPYQEPILRMLKEDIHINVLLVTTIHNLTR